MKKITLIVPVYNEEESIEVFISTVNSIIEDIKNIHFEYLFVNDGSKDNTLLVLLKLIESQKNIRVINFSRNFGKEKALMAGIKNAQQSDAVIITDVDLQDPPEIIKDFIIKWEQGIKNIYGLRNNRQADSFLKRFTAGVFYNFFNKLSSINIPAHAGDYRLLDKDIVQIISQVHNKNLFMKGIYSWAGYSSDFVAYKREKRSKGTTKFNFIKLFKLSLDGVFSFSTVPLKLASISGVFLSFGALVFAISIIVKKVLYDNPIPGYSSLMVTILFFFGVQFIFMGILGEYIARIYDETKQEPVYIIENIISYESIKNKNKFD